MDFHNFTIVGHLGIPGFVRVPPPFGTPRDAVRAIKAAQARASEKQQPELRTDGLQLPPAPWRQRLTVMAVGVACTVAAALIGSHTGQRRQPVPHFDQAPVLAIAQPPAPTVSPDMLPVEASPPMLANQHAEKAAETTETALTTAAQPAPAKTAGRTVTPAAPARSATSTDKKSEAAETYRAMTEALPISSGYVAPGAPVRIDLQRHTRLTD